MHRQNSSVRLKAAIYFWPLCFSLLVSGCAPVSPPVIASPAPVPADPILAFVSSGGIGQSASVNERPDGQAVGVTIESQYNSALGQVCRSYDITRTTGQVQQLACDDGTTWHTVPPLLNANNEAAIP